MNGPKKASSRPLSAVADIDVRRLSMIPFATRWFHSVCCWWVVRTARKYYERKSIRVIGELKKAIEDKNCRATQWVSYSIRKLSQAKGMSELLEQLASIKTKEVDSERQFNNILTELHAASFLSKTFGETVVEVESRSHKIRSPYAAPNKFCDIKTASSIGELYYEVKDASSEITTSYQDRGITHFERMDDDKIEQWIKDQTKEVDKCGAQYLICRVPVWLEDASKTEDFYRAWVNRVFKKQFHVIRQLSTREIIVHPNFLLSPHVKGIYVLKAFGYIKLIFA